MYKTLLYTLVNGKFKDLHIENNKKLQMVILPASPFNIGPENTLIMLI